MDSIDQQVLRQLHQWLSDEQACWLCTIVRTVGSFPRPIGSLLACNDKGQMLGSLSGGCVEDDLLEKIQQGQLAADLPEVIEYGISAEQNEKLGLPCGGRMYVLIEPLSNRQLDDIALINERLGQRQCCERRIDLASGESSVEPVDQFRSLDYKADEQQVRQTFGPRYLIVIVGAGQLARSVAELALMLDYRVLVCDPRQSLIEGWTLDGVELVQGMPDDVVRQHVTDEYSIVITLTHDPRIDDMALMEALTGKAFYVGALGSTRTSEKRRERLRQLNLSEVQIEKLHAPVGMSIGSKTPPEIAVAIMAELTRLRRQS